MVASWITPKARKGMTSAIAGRGLVAVATIEQGEVVAIKGGHIITTDTLRQLPERLRNSEIQIADGKHLAALTDEEYEPVMRSWPWGSIPSRPPLHHRGPDG